MKNSEKKSYIPFMFIFKKYIQLYTIIIIIAILL